MSTQQAQRPDADRIRAALTARRDAVAAAWSADDGLDDAVVLLPGGLVMPIEGSDQSYGFRAHDDVYYLSGAREAGQVLAYEPENGWRLFTPVASQEDRVWHGDVPAPEALGERVGIAQVHAIDEFGPWLSEQSGRTAALLGSRDALERPIGYGLHPGDLDALGFDADLTERLQARVTSSRRRKDDVEIDLMRAAAACSHAGHHEGWTCARAGMTERQLEVEIDAAFQRAGAERRAYSSIVAAGSNAAVLHASPSGRALAEGDLVLVDAGAEFDGYDSDVTRTWPVSSSFTAEQRAIYDLVLAVQAEAIAGVRAGVEFRALHMQACRTIAAGLVDFGVLRGDPDVLVERDAHAVFFPHGLGHLIGLATHDVGGWPADRKRSDRPGLKFLRIDLPLEAGYVVTIEPGIYFVRALLEDEELRRKHHDDVNWEKADALVEFGGVRIEDDVLVTENGADVLTAAIPKAADEIEALRS